MDINLSLIFFAVFAAVGAAFSLLCFLKGRIKGFTTLGATLRFLCLQGLVSLGFMLVYVLFVKNGLTPSLSDLGVAFIPLTVGVYWAAWGFGALPTSPYSLLLPVGYCLFLLWQYYTASKGVFFFGYVVFNPAFGFIGSQLKGTVLEHLGAVSAVVPLLCAVIGRAFGTKTIDNHVKMCDNEG